MYIVPTESVPEIILECLTPTAIDITRNLDPTSPRPPCNQSSRASFSKFFLFHSQGLTRVDGRVLLAPLIKQSHFTCCPHAGTNKVPSFTSRRHDTARKPPAIQGPEGLDAMRSPSQGHSLHLAHELLVVNAGTAAS